MEKTLEQKVCGLYETTTLTLQQMADQLGTTYKIVWNIVAKDYPLVTRRDRKRNSYRESKLGEKNPMFGKIGEQHHNYIGEVFDGKGYIMVLKPSWYTGRKGSKHVFKHSVVFCEAAGLSEIPAGFLIHHLDMNPQNNDLSNLALMTNRAHIHLHAILRRATTIPKGSREAGNLPKREAAIEVKSGG